MSTVASLAAMVDGEVVGDANVPIRGVADLASAGPDQISFLANSRYTHVLAETRAGAVLLERAHATAPCSQIVCARPYLALARIAKQLHPTARPAAGVHPMAFVDPAAVVDASASVAAGAVVEAGARVGAYSVIGATCVVGEHACLGVDVRMHSGSKVLARCIVGDRVILQAGAVIGADGFGYAPDEAGRREKIPQLGIVVLEDDVEVGANSTIDRATFGVTRIGARSKIDNLVQLGHNVELGEDCVVVAQAGIAGSTRLGDRVILGAQAGTVGHLTIASDVSIAARGGATSDLPQAGVYAGFPMQPHREWLRTAAAQRTLPQLRQRHRELSEKLRQLELRVDASASRGAEVMQHTPASPPEDL